jgi:hypothetical protein
LNFGIKISDLQVALIFNCLDVGFKIFDTIDKLDSLILDQISLPLNQLVLGFKILDLLSFLMTLPLPIFSILILPIDEISDKTSEPVVFIPLLTKDLPELIVSQIKVVILLIALFKH